ncbi:MAG: pseudaminic acid cytidylyltransferase [Desulfobulbaceae bacterium]|nr:pseudaminic acid cytidylyltransferase [Desulfobulbaceae bacterium]
MNIALIPARGGSKRIPGKNIKNFCGKPIIAYSIEAALEAQIFDRIIVSTDSDEIGSVARQYGAEVPFVRPAELADDFSTTAAVVEHGLNWLYSQGEKIRYLCCLYATAPFVTGKYLRQGFEKIVSEGVSSVFTVTSYPSSIYRALLIGEKGYLTMVHPEHELTRSNDLPETYYDAGQFYWLDAGSFMETQRIYSRDALPVILPRFLVQDIDTSEDWKTAELMYEALKKRGE